MKNHLLLGILLITLLLEISASAIPTREIRSFTRTSDEKKIEAYVVSYDGKKVTLQVTGKNRYTLDPKIFTNSDQEYLKKWLYRSKGIPLASELDSRIKPGASFRVEMPDLAKTFTNKTAGFTISIPKNFNYPEPQPLLVFLNGGSGNESLSKAKSITRSRDYILVSLPFTSEINKDGPLGQKESNMKLIESYHKAMLDKLQTLIPNLSKTHRAIVGSSNGAHILGSALAMDWDCYLDFFNAFALWEGGGSLSRNFRAAKDKRYRIFVGWGAKSESKDFVIGIADAMDNSRVQVTKKAVATAGHGMNKEATETIEQWLLNVAEPAFKQIDETRNR